jgi:hypothetical protein
MIGTIPAAGSRAGTARTPTIASPPLARTRSDARTATIARGLTMALIAVVAISGLVTIVAPSVLRDPPAYAGNALGTFVVLLVVALPAVAIAMRAARRGSLAARFVWLGGVGYMLYNAILTSFSLRFNELFLLYVASLSLAVWSFIAVLATFDVGALPARFSSRFPVRLVGGYLIATALAFAALWLSDVLPATFSGARPLSLRGTTLPSNTVQVIDFAFTLPVSFAAGLWLWRRRPWGFLLSGTMLVLLLLESVSIAVDQYFGHRADPSQPTGTIVLFVALTVIGAVPAIGFVGSIGSGSGSPAEGGVAPT